MLDHTALPDAPSDGRTASKDPLNGAKCRLPVAKPVDVVARLKALLSGV